MTETVRANGLNVADKLQDENCSRAVKKRKSPSRGRLPNGAPNPIDVHVGKRIKLRRRLLELSQEKVAELVGITFQQFQKYEHGANRISASRLWDISTALEIPISFFFEDMDKKVAAQSPRMFCISGGRPKPLLWRDKENKIDPMATFEAINLVKAYYKIENRKAAKQLYDLIIAFSKA